MFAMIFSSIFPVANKRDENTKTAIITNVLVAYLPKPSVLVKKKPTNITTPKISTAANSQMSESILLPSRLYETGIFPQEV